jgi:subtilisin family serine protease
MKPDLIAPGEKIVSCDSDQRREARGLKTSASMTVASAPASPQVASNPEPTTAEAEIHERTSSGAATVTAGTPTASSDRNLTPTKVYALYREDSGTSMAAPHVSGVIAAFLSVRREFIGQAERVKEIFLSTATDLRRERYFQGHGLVDLMRAIQSV